MGNLNTNSNKHAVKSATRVCRSKGERLGWKSLDEQIRRPLRDIVGDGEKVDPNKYVFIDSSIKFLIP